MTGPHARQIAGPIAVFVLVTGLYLARLPVGFVYDDFEVIVAQAPARSLSDVLRVFAEPHGLPLSQLPYYRPITRATLLVQKGWHGDAPVAFRAGNAVLAGLAALLAFALLRAPALGLSRGVALVAAALFAVHPVASSCVYPSASGRESLVPALFVLAATAAFLRSGWRPWLLALLAFAGALFSKEQAVVVPGIFLAADALGLSGDPPGRRPLRWLARHAPVVALLLVYLAVRGAVLGKAPDDVGAVLRAPDPMGPVRTGLYAVQVLLAPSGRLAYEPAWEVWLSPPRLAVACTAFAALGAAAARGGAGGGRRALFWLVWLALTLLPTANLYPQETRFAERFAFLGALAPIALAADVADRRLPARAAVAVGTALALACAALTLHRAVYYRDNLAFARQWVRTSPAHANAHYALGTSLARAGDARGAIAELRDAVRLEPLLAAAHYNLGVVLAREGRRAEAGAAFEEAVRLHPRDADAHFYLGVLAEQRGRSALAAGHYRAALEARPGWAEPAEGLSRVDPPPP